MAIDNWDKFIGNNWERYADLCGGVSACLVIIFACMTWFFKYNTGIGVYTFFIGLFMLWEETPILDWIRGCKESFNNTVQMKHPAVRAVVYILASILMFFYQTPCIGAGIFLLLTAILKFFAQINVTADARAEKSSLNTSLNSGL